MKTSIRILAGLLAGASCTTIAHAGDIVGNVADATGTRALQAASVRIVELDRSADTSRDGSYIFADVPQGTYTLEVTYVGAVMESHTITVPASGRVTGNFALSGIGGDAILVTGQSANLASALSRKQAADGVSDVLTRDAVGEFPDQNVAESLRRLPGVNILNDQGEGRFVSIRGLDPNLVSTSLNGVRVPSPESDVRQVALDVISSDTIESIEVKKSLTPDMDADAIGGSVEIHTTSAFDRKKDYYSVKAEGSYNKYNGQITPKASFDFSKRLGEDFGVAGSISYYKRKFETDNVESDPWTTNDDGTVYSQNIEYRDYDVTRTRINASLNFDWRASDTTKVYLRTNWSQFDDHEYRRRTTFNFEDATDITATDTGISVSDTDGTIEVTRDLKDRFERQRIGTVALGGDTDTGTWKFNWMASYAKSSEEEHGSIDPIAFRSKFEDDGVAMTWNYSDVRVPTYTLTSGADAVNDASNYTLNKIEVTSHSDSQDEEYALKADLARTFAMDGGDLTLQAGAKQRWRDKTYDLTQTDYAKNKTLTMADYLGSQTYRLDGISLGPVLAKSAGVAFMNDYADTIEIDEDGTLIDSAASDYGASEDITAAYALARWDSASLRVIGGVRMERTHNDLTGNLYNEETLEITPVEFKRSYTTWLPSLTMRWNNEAGNIVARLAGYKSLMRPNLSDLAPRFSVNEDNEAEFGNPDLKPYQAWNLDFGVEYYFTGNGALTFGSFYKKVDDFIVTRYYTQQYSAITGATYDELRIAENGGNATIAGFEVGFSQAYTMLPAPFDGLLTQVNYTYAYSKGTVYDTDDVAYRTSLPSNSRNTFNVVVGYDKGPVDLRLAGTYRDKYLDELGDTQEEDRWVDNHFQLDFSAKFAIMDGMKLTFDVININNAKYYAYENYEGAKRLLQFEKYGPTFKAGIKANF
ncbi:TonB-dependent receptor [Novosphingobium sp. 1949]|uniref:TonB-dependent receptor n=1 Tax=Novosphingobium organovorum TaxID=2930092 RepID=A0ABT0BCT7_9SPHN|nr:TonB-dependent receptor [Novosphingobium organovorum]MCJ2182869.1 TonB-dependent receptor [Novosphingobium organovorum]